MARLLLLLRCLLRRGLRGWFAALIGLVVVGQAYAEGTVPAGQPVYRYWRETAPGVYWDTYQGICQQMHDYHQSIASGGQPLTNESCDQGQWSADVPGYGRVLYQIFREVASYSCPANSTAVNATTCTCDAGYSPGEGVLAGFCVPPTNCPADSTFSSGWYDIGSDITAFQMGSCVGGCAYTYDGFAASKTQIVNGVKHYFAQGSYKSTGQKCGAGNGDPGNAPPPPVPTPEVPPATCPAGQQPGTIDRGNGPERFCAPVGTPSPAASSPQPAASGVPDSPKDETVCTKTEDVTLIRTVCTTRYANGSVGTTTSEQNKNTGQTTTTNSGANVGGSGSGAGTPGSGVGSPMSPGNSASGSGTGSSGNGSGSGGGGGCSSNPSSAGCGGAPGGIGEGYTGKDKTVSGVLSARRDQFMGSGIGAATVGFFAVSGEGTCPISNWTIPYIDADVPFNVMCSEWALQMIDIMKVVVLLCFAYYAFRVCID